MATPQLAEHLRTLDLIQEEADHQPRFFKANYELHTPRLLAIAQALRAELATAREELAPYEPFNPQQCAKGLHVDWLADSEYTHSCPWCLIAEQQEALAARPGCPDPIECDHEAEASQLRAELEQTRQHSAVGAANTVAMFNLRNMITSECDAIDAEVYGQHDEDDDGKREATARIRTVLKQWRAMVDHA